MPEEAEHSPTDDKAPDKRGTSKGRALVLGPWISSTPLAALLAVLIYALGTTPESGKTFWSVFAVGFITASAALIVGALIGFLFGLPRVLEQAPTGAFGTNTNLDQISDWLTKIIVGLGLVELGRMTHAAGDLASIITPGLGTGDGVRAFVIALLVYSIVDGFLVGYLWTRIVVSIRLKQAHEALVRADQAADEVLSAPLAPPPVLPLPPGGQPVLTQAE